MIVTSSPARRMAARPIGIVYGSVGTMPRFMNSAVLSMNTHGSSSSMHASSRPLASYGVDGKTTLSPGVCIRSASSDWLCWAPIGVPPTMFTRTVIGTGVRPPDM